MPNDPKNKKMILPNNDLGYMSPYPTVVIVTSVSHIALYKLCFYLSLNILSNGDSAITSNPVKKILPINHKIYSS